jgi:hypothetical protein
VCVRACMRVCVRVCACVRVCVSRGLPPSSRSFQAVVSMLCVALATYLDAVNLPTNPPPFFPFFLHYIMVEQEKEK